jgi:hypothetical protein
VGDKHFREIFFYKDYYLDFFKILKPDVQKRINWTLQLIATIDRVPQNILTTLLTLLAFLKFG